MHSMTGGGGGAGGQQHAGNPGPGPGPGGETSQIGSHQQRFPSSSSSIQQQPRSLSQQSPTAPIDDSKPVGPPAYPWSRRPLDVLPLSLLSSDPSSPPSWGGPSPAPFPRYGHSVNPVAMANGDLYIFGGLVSGLVKNDLYVINCASMGPGPLGLLAVGMVETRGELPSTRVGHASVGVGNVLIVWGGDTKKAPGDVQDDALYLLNTSESG